jgi:hypothetical protein
MNAAVQPNARAAQRGGVSIAFPWRFHCFARTPETAVFTGDLGVYPCMGGISARSLLGSAGVDGLHPRIAAATRAQLDARRS